MRQLRVLKTDLDGILFHSMEIAFGINKEINPSLTREEYAKWFDGNVFEAKNKDNINQKSLSSDDELFFQLYERVWPSIEVYEEVADIYHELHSKGVIIEGITSNCEDKVHFKLAQYGMRNIFSGLGGYQTHKSKVEKFGMLAKKYPGARVAHPTDTTGDVREALKANELGVADIGNITAVTWGLKSHDRKRFEKTRPHAIVDQPSELRETLFDYFEL